MQQIERGLWLVKVPEKSRTQMPERIQLSRKRDWLAARRNWAIHFRLVHAHATRRRISTAMPDLDRSLIGTAGPSENSPKYPAAFRLSMESSGREKVHVRGMRATSYGPNGLLIVTKCSKCSPDLTRWRTDDRMSMRGGRDCRSDRAMDRVRNRVRSTCAS